MQLGNILKELFTNFSPDTRCKVELLLEGFAEVTHVLIYHKIDGVKERVKSLSRIKVIGSLIQHTQRLLDDSLEEVRDLFGVGILERKGAGFVPLLLLHLLNGHRWSDELTSQSHSTSGPCFIDGLSLLGYHHGG